MVQFSIYYLAPGKGRSVHKNMTRNITSQDHGPFHGVADPLAGTPVWQTVYRLPLPSTDVKFWDWSYTKRISGFREGKYKLHNILSTERKAFLLGVFLSLAYCYQSTCKDAGKHISLWLVPVSWPYLADPEVAMPPSSNSCSHLDTQAPPLHLGHQDGDQKMSSETVTVTTVTL